MVDISNLNNAVLSLFTLVKSPIKMWQGIKFILMLLTEIM